MPFIYTDLVKKTYNFKALNDQFSLKIGDVLKLEKNKVNEDHLTGSIKSSLSIESCEASTCNESLIKKPNKDYDNNKSNCNEEIVEIDDHIDDKSMTNLSKINAKFQTHPVNIVEDVVSSDDDIQMVATVEPIASKAPLKTANPKRNTRSSKSLANKKTELNGDSHDTQEDMNRALQDLLKKTGAILNQCSRPNLDLSLSKMDGDEEDIQFQEIDTVTLLIRYMGNNNKIHRINLKVNDRLEILIAKICELEDLIDNQTHDLPSLSAACDMLKLQYKGEDLSFFATPEQIKLRSGSLIECLRKRTQDPLSRAKLTSTALLDTRNSVKTIKLRIQYNDVLVKAAQIDAESSLTSTVALKVGFYEIIAQEYQPLTEISQKFCSDLGLNPNKIMFRFDGELLPISKTIVDLELENEDTLDAILKT